MRYVAVLGAGVSLAEAMFHRPVQDREHPPLDADFFEKAASFEVPLRATLSRHASAIGLTDPFAKQQPRMEEFFGDVYYEVHESTGSQQVAALAAYRALLRLYGRVIARSTNWMFDRPLGPVGRYLRALLDMDGLEELTFITFNHDLVLENCLVQLPYRQRWCVDRGYGQIALRSATTKGSVQRLPTHSANCDHGIPITVLKLHGSLNWQVQTRSHEPSYGDLFPSTTTQPTVECITDRVVSVTLERMVGNRRWRLWPQIVPPIYQKMGIVTARFADLWTDASRAIDSADRLSVIGYSMPAADTHAAKLIKRAVRKNRLLRSIDVVNPDPQIAARLGSLCEIDRIAWHRGLSDYSATL